MPDSEIFLFHRRLSGVGVDSSQLESSTSLFHTYIVIIQQNVVGKRLSSIWPAMKKQRSNRARVEGKKLVNLLELYSVSYVCKNNGDGPLKMLVVTNVPLKTLVTTPPPHKKLVIASGYADRGPRHLAALASAHLCIGCPRIIRTCNFPQLSLLR